MGLLDALLESLLLFLIVHGEPVFDQNDAATDEHLLEQGAEAQEFAVLLIGAEADHSLDAGAVVPAPVEEHDLAA